MNNTKVAIAMSRMVSWIQMAAGWFFLVIFGACTLMYPFDADLQEDGIGMLIMCIVFDVISIALIMASRKRKKLIAEFKKYVSILSTDPSGSIANLAAAEGTSQDVVKANLELMIKRKYFVNAYINQETNCIIIGGNRNQVPTSASAGQMGDNVSKTSGESKVPLIPVTCKCCGGMNKVAKGSVSECDFCGSPIDAK